MKEISIQDLKATLSAVVAEAESGETIVITRHNHAVAQLGPPQSKHVHRGKNVGTGAIKPALKRGIRIPYLTVLLDDRGQR